MGRTPIGFTLLRIVRAWRRRQAAPKSAYEKDLEAFKAQGGVAGKRRQEKKEAKQELAAKRAKKADRDPNKPKKPQTAYWLWLGENRASLSKEVGADITKVSKLAGERWKALPEKAKAPFDKKAAELKAVYDKAMAEYKKTAGDVGGDDEDEEDAEEQ